MRGTRREGTPVSAQDRAGDGHRSTPRAAVRSSAAPALAAWIEGIGCLGPGFDDWNGARAILRGEVPYESRPTQLPAPAALPASERRRASRSIKVALATGFAAIEMSGHDASALPTVFTASAGDGQNCHELCQQLSGADRQISPTRFHNSVHNAPAGYWGIAAGAMATSTVLCGHDASFGAGLLEALVQVTAEQRPVVLIAYDTDYPEPLRATRPVPDAIGVALVLAPESSARALARIAIRLTGEPAETMPVAGLEALRRAAPVGRALPLLAALAAGGPRSVTIDYLETLRLAIDVAPARR